MIPLLHHHTILLSSFQKSAISFPSNYLSNPPIIIFVHTQEKKVSLSLQDIMLKAQSPDLVQKREAILMIRYEASKMKLFFYDYY